jgi:hypothetical protein
MCVSVFRKESRAMRKKPMMAGAAACVAAVGLALMLGLAGANGTAFTYQGRLTDAGKPATGLYDLEFKLFDAPTGGMLVAMPLTINDQQVTDGVFKVTLDFGPGSLEGGERWLEIGVRSARSIGMYTTLSPRHDLTTAPGAGVDGPGGDTLLSVPIYGQGVTSATAAAIQIVKLDANGSSCAKFRIDDPNCPGNALWAVTKGRAHAGVFQIDNAPNSTAAVLYASTNGVGRDGHAYAGWFELTNPNNSSPVLYATRPATATGPGLHVDCNCATVKLQDNDDPGSYTQLIDAGPPQLRIEKTNAVDPNATQIDVNVMVMPGRDAAFRVFRTTNTTGRKRVFFHRGNNTTATSAVIGVDREASYFQRHGGNVTIGTNDPNYLDPGMVMLKVQGGSDASPLSGGIIQVGPGRDPNHTNNLAIDDNEIQARQAGGPSGLMLNNEGGNVTISGASSDGLVGIGTSSMGTNRLKVVAAGARNAIAGVANTAGYSAVDGQTTAALTTVGQERWGVKGTNPADAVTGALAYAKRYSGLLGLPYTTNYAVYGKASSGYAGFFDGLVNMTGNLTVAGDVLTAGKLGVGRIAAANSLEVEGQASKTTAGSWAMNSDSRIKTDIETVSGALDKLDKVRLVSFRYKDEYRAAHPSIEDRRYINVLAQEFAEAFPDDVTPGGDKLANGESILQVDSYPLTVYSAAAVQELHQIVKAKEAEIAALKEDSQAKQTEMTSLKDRLSKLEALVGKLSAAQQGGAR